MILAKRTVPLDELDHKHLVSHKWWIPTADDASVHLDLTVLDSKRHCRFPERYRWCSGVGGSTGTTAEWFIYAIPMLAAVYIPDTIFWDPHPPNGFVTSDVDGILHRAELIVPTRCDVEKLRALGYVDSDSLWPSVHKGRVIKPSTACTQRAAMEFCSKCDADFYPIIE